LLILDQDRDILFPLNNHFSKRELLPQQEIRPLDEFIKVMEDPECSTPLHKDLKKPLIRENSQEF
jgi:hypothetical protein